MALGVHKMMAGSINLLENMSDVILFLFFLLWRAVAARVAKFVRSNHIFCCFEDLTCVMFVETESHLRGSQTGKLAYESYLSILKK